MCIDLCTGKADRSRLTPGGVQQQLPERIQACHAVKQYNAPRAAVQNNLLRIIICRFAKPSIKRGQVFRKSLRKLLHIHHSFVCAVYPLCRNGIRAHTGLGGFVHETAALPHYYFVSLRFVCHAADGQAPAGRITTGGAGIHHPDLQSGIHLH